MLAALAAGLLIYAADDSHAFLNRLHAAKDAFEQCVYSEARQEYRGHDTPELEQSIASACRQQFDAWSSALIWVTDPRILPDVTAKVHQQAETGEQLIVHLAVVAAAAGGGQPR